MNQWTNEPMNQWTNEPMNQWTNEPINQWTNQPMNQWTNEPMNQWTNEQMNQLTNEPMNHQLINPSTNHPTNQQMNNLVSLRPFCLVIWSSQSSPSSISRNSSLLRLIWIRNLSDLDPKPVGSGSETCRIQVYEAGGGGGGCKYLVRNIVSTPPLNHELYWSNAYGQLAEWTWDDQPG